MNTSPFRMRQIAGLSIRDVIDHHAETRSDQVFLVDPSSGQTVTYAEMRAHARAVVDRIAAEGVEPGDSVAYAMPNGFYAALSVLGLFYGGYLATAINSGGGQRYHWLGAGAFRRETDSEPWQGFADRGGCVEGHGPRAACSRS